jgi:hypothetical protein
VLHGTRTYVLQDEAGNIELTHSISAGLDYAAIGPEHVWLRELGRTEYVNVSDAEALAAVDVDQPPALVEAGYDAHARIEQLQHLLARCARPREAEVAVDRGQDRGAHVGIDQQPPADVPVGRDADHATVGLDHEQRAGLVLVEATEGVGDRRAGRDREGGDRAHDAAPARAVSRQKRA